MISEETKESVSLILDDILEYIFSDATLSNAVIFKGGTALAKVYNLKRFSKDIDLSYIGRGYGNVVSYIKTFIEGLGLGVTNVSANSIEFKIGALKSSIDVSYLRDVIEKDVGMTKVKSRRGGTYFVRAMALDEILAEKIRAIMERREGKDLWDAYEILKSGTTCALSQIMYKCEHSDQPFSFDCTSFAKVVESWTEHRYKGQLADYIDEKDIAPLSKVKRELIRFINSIC